MIFTRTSAGIANYPKFFGVDIAIYIEGQDSAGNLQSADHFFYTQLFSEVLNGKRVKIKCVGNRQSVLRHIELLEAEEEPNSLAVIDRDLEGVRCSLLRHPLLIYTYGYSWENDFWTLELATSLVRDLCLHNVDATEVIRHKFKNARRRVSFIAKLDASLQLSGDSLLPKNGGACGLAIGQKGRFPIRTPEIKRLLARYRANRNSKCTIASEFIRSLRNVPAEAITQGHLWASIVYRIISDTCRVFTGEMAPAKTMMSHLALTKFATSPRQYMEAPVLNYYASEITSRLK